ncbi:lysozyme inhibitor LprI family protein [Pseudocolwellia agarivorans]|uniref:lysozyme inhibitor LprI family protein n=1 Tax=Pseudocolwellia agarivorans TaxID=1911682 RepID=UPI00098794E2|nr:lysozyme inhibitor LprI family protein [Pseudocolwellia agarivorans]
MIKRLIAIATPILFSSTLVFADTKDPIFAKCLSKETNNSKYSQCLDTVKIKIDRELETWVNNQLFILEEIARTTGRKSAYDMFKRSQKNFVTFRDNNCKWQFLAELPSNVSAPTYKECYILTSRDRIKELSRIAK